MPVKEDYVYSQLYDGWQWEPAGYWGSEQWWGLGMSHVHRDW